MPTFTRRDVLGAAATGVAALSLPRILSGDPGLAPIDAEIGKRHAESVQRLQEWIRLPSIAAEKRGMSEGCELMMKLLTDAGFQSAVKVPTDGQPGVFATLDAGAKRTGSGAHAPDEYFVIESSNPKVQGFDGAVRSYVDYLFELSTIS